jgi:hypothetical protein
MPAFASTWVRLGVFAVVLSISKGTAASADIDARAEVAAALYAASATQAAAENQTDTKLKALRTSIDQLQEKVHSSVTEAAGLRSELASAQEKFVANLAAHDRAYSEEIGVFRAAVQDIAATPAGAEALARFNAGDEVGALAVLAIGERRAMRRDRSGRKSRARRRQGELPCWRWTQGRRAR